MARSGQPGAIYGTPTETSPMTNYTVYSNNSQTGVEFTFALAILADADGDGLPDDNSVTGLEIDNDDDNDGVLDELELKCGSDPADNTGIAEVDENGECITDESGEDEEKESNCWYCYCFSCSCSCF